MGLAGKILFSAFIFFVFVGNSSAQENDPITSFTETTLLTTVIDVKCVEGGAYSTDSTHPYDLAQDLPVTNSENAPPARISPLKPVVDLIDWLQGGANWLAPNADYYHWTVDCELTILGKLAGQYNGGEPVSLYVTSIRGPPGSDRDYISCQFSPPNRNSCDTDFVWDTSDTVDWGTQSRDFSFQFNRDVPVSIQEVCAEANGLGTYGIGTVEPSWLVIDEVEESSICAYDVPVMPGPVVI